VTLSAAALAGLLADDDRRLVAAALILGASSLDDVMAMTGLDVPRGGKALGRLVDAGLVERGRDGTLHLLGQAFAAAAKAAAMAAPPVDTGVGGAEVPPEQAKVLRAFIRDGRLLSIPTARNKRLVVLDVLAQEFEPGRRYTEASVNLMLGRWHRDTAALRRYLVDEGFLDREDRVYWRAGGTFDPAAGAEPGTPAPGERP
jgi:hypothetical protein